MRHWLARLLALGLSCLALGGCKEPPPLPHDAYVWQRQWTPAVSDAIGQAGEVMRAWHVLAGFADDGRHVQAVVPDWQALRHSGKPVVLVIRIDGPLPLWDDDGLLNDIQAVLASWQNLPIAGIEIDHDSPTSRLRDYAHFLARLRGRIGDLPLSATGLPTWLGSPDLDTVLAQVDEFVLQVHGLNTDGLFDRHDARRWLEQLAGRTTKPFRVALPAYGVRVGRDEAGTVTAVESEAPLLRGAAHSDELMVAPEDVAALLRDLDRRRPAHLVGVVWFRLPTPQDRRAWSLATLKAVIAGRVAQPRLSAVAEDSATPGMVTLALVNAGEVDARLPQRLVLPDDCALADGVNGYALERQGTHLFLRRLHDGVLHEHRRQAVGWARCAVKPEILYVEP